MLKLEGSSNIRKMSSQDKLKAWKNYYRDKEPLVDWSSVFQFSGETYLVRLGLGISILKPAVYSEAINYGFVSHETGIEEALQDPNMLSEARNHIQISSIFCQFLHLDFLTHSAMRAAEC